MNNPQLSDVQFQVDSGDVFFTHSFMLYTRCPLLASMVSVSLAHKHKLIIKKCRRNNQAVTMCL